MGNSIIQQRHLRNHERQINQQERQIEPVQEIRHPDQPHRFIKREQHFRGKIDPHRQQHIGMGQQGQPRGNGKPDEAILEAKGFRGKQEW
ncbi:hypothetical protein D3C71_1931590 [compost metagenome]